MTVTELKAKSVKELISERFALLKEQLSLRIQRGTGQAPPQPHFFKKVRRDIARVNTIIREKEGSGL